MNCSCVASQPGFQLTQVAADVYSGMLSLHIIYLKANVLLLTATQIKPMKVTVTKTDRPMHVPPPQTQDSFGLVTSMHVILC